jgi:chaperone required for assembly of F1-ATPase
MKRFYSVVEVTPAHGITLDGRTVRTPGKAELTLPSAAFAERVAAEWRAQGDRVDPRTMPLTGLSNAAIDFVVTNSLAFTASIALYAETELLCYRAGDPPDLVARQNDVWDPLLAWASARYGVAFVKVAGIMHRPQPAETVQRLASTLDPLGPFALAALSAVVTIGGSLVIGLALLEAALNPGDAFNAAHLDDLWQAEQWGEDDFALEARAAHRRDFLNGCDVLNLLRD